MPPDAPLPQEQVSIIKTWIDQGAEWPDVLSGETVTSQPDLAVVKMMHALRNGNRQEFNRALRDNPKSVNGKGQGGWTPIMFAALYGDAEDVKLLLAQGADPNAQNDGGGTSLMYAIEDAEKIRLLLDRGAEANARSGEGRTALLIAVGRAGSNAVVQLLLERGASASARLPDGRGALQLAVAARDASLLRLLLDHGAGRAPLPLANALLAGCTDCFDMLLPLAEPSSLNSALTAATRLGDLQTIKILLTRGAKPDPNILQTVALSTNAIPVDIIETLIGAGARTDAKTSIGTILDFAKRQGNTALVDALSRAGVSDQGSVPSPPKPKPSGSVRGALDRSLPLLQRADVAFMQRAGCVSCHNNSLTAMTVAA
ncbi:MAG: ankyrin repeat domain-containing protein, partial [Vicinamibacterales bacterium]|nr:ankyrin repeat domain-containing protein [Vicinamibacterales bacterium]